MISRLKKFFQNLDNDQKAILKSAALISALVLPISIVLLATTPNLNTPVLLILAAILQSIITPFFAHKVTHKKQYTFDKKSNKKYKTAITDKFLTAHAALYCASGLVIIFLEGKPIYLMPFLIIAPLWITRLVAVKLKLPASALLLRSLRTIKGQSQHQFKPMQFDSSHIDSSNRWHEEQSNRQLTTPAYSSLASNMYHNQYHKK